MARRSAGDVAALIACGLFAAASFTFASDEDIGWWAGWFWTAGFLALLLISPGWKPLVEELEVTDFGVTRRFGPWLRKKKEERVSWQDLTQVEILTTDAGPSSEDLFFILHGRDGKGVAVSNDLAVKHGLVATLQNRLPGLDNKAIIDASLCIEVRRFLVWQKTG
ncbi:MAG TPA: hypothetical protein VLF42_13925 [Burkholderiales bacterium]|nr:hypothetical protein [Burkholderiales bacterium]